jgi:hypothetical protein
MRASPATSETRDRRQVVEADGRLPDALRPQHAQGPGPLRVHRVGQHIAGLRLNQERRVTDERDRGSRAIERRRLPHLHIDALRPPRSWLEQHPWNRREGLPRVTTRVEESLPVEVIALVQANPERALVRCLPTVGVALPYRTRLHGPGC